MGIYAPDFQSPFPSMSASVLKCSPKGLTVLDKYANIAEGSLPCKLEVALTGLNGIISVSPTRPTASNGFLWSHFSQAAVRPPLLHHHHLSQFGSLLRITPYFEFLASQKRLLLTFLSAKMLCLFLIFTSFWLKDSSNLKVLESPPHPQADD